MTTTSVIPEYEIILKLSEQSRQMTVPEMTYDEIQALIAYLEEEIEEREWDKRPHIPNAQTLQAFEESEAGLLEKTTLEQLRAEMGLTAK